MNKYALLFISVFALGSAGPIGCSALAKKIVKDPKVTLEHVHVTDLELSGATVVFELSVQNPNSFPLEVDSVRYNVELGGKDLGPGTLPKGAKVEGKTTKVIPIPYPFKYKDVFPSVVDFLKSGTSTYKLKGEAKLGPLSLPFDKTGELHFKK